MREQAIERIVSGIKDLPTLPSILVQINTMVKNDLVTIHEVGTMIERDPSLTSKVLKLANSSYYGLSYRVNTVTRAIIVLGINTIRNLAVTASVFKIFNRGAQFPLDIKGLWYHSLGCAIASKGLISSIKPALEEEAFVSGILHDIGKVVIAQNLPDFMERILKELKDSVTMTQSEVERNIIGYTHSEAGAMLAEKWHFPKELSEVIKYHHNPSYRNSNSQPIDPNLLLYAVYAGNQIAKGMALGKSTDERVKTIEASAWTHLGISDVKLKEILFQIKMDFESAVESWKPGE